MLMMQLNKYGIICKKVLYDFDELQDVDSEKVALHKAQQIMKIAKGPFIIEDTGTYIESLKGFPGSLFKQVFFYLGYKKLLSLLDNETNRRAYFKGVVVYGDPITNEIRVL